MVYSSSGIGILSDAVIRFAMAAPAPMPVAVAPPSRHCTCDDEEGRLPRAGRRRRRGRGRQGREEVHAGVLQAHTWRSRCLYSSSRMAYVGTRRNAGTRPRTPP
uniref:Uncharacterized protein n=1 Tax=Arundo donax TaxID=35708 RepID=A0A0A9B273_ARUDO